MNIVSKEENFRVTSELIVKQCFSQLETKFSDYLLNWLHVTVLIERKESNFGNKKHYLTLLSERLSCVSVIFTDDLA